MSTEIIAEKPYTINYSESAIPERLRVLPRWTVRTGKNPGHGWNMDENLKTYDKALELARRVDADGVMFIWGKGTGLTLTDLDHCRNPQTGEIEPGAQRIIDELDSYTEISSSGTGVHIITEAEKPGPRCRTNAFPDFEVYDDVRPALITGDRLNDMDIESRQQQIEDLYHEVFPPEIQRDPVDVEPTGLTDTEVLDNLFAEDNGPKWRTVLDGLWGEHYASRSDADFAIAGKLAFYSGDQDQVEQIMNGSGLYRDKFDERRGPVTYLQQTIGRIFDKLDATYTHPSSLRMTVGKGKRKGLLAGAVPMGQMMRDGIEPPDELINSVLLKGQVHQVFCGPGKGKSWLALWMAVRLVNRGLRVLYLDKENGPRMIRNRLVALGADPTRVDESLTYIPFPSLDLEPDAVQDYVDSLDGFSLVIFDSWINYLAAAGLDENSNGDLARWSTTFCAEARKRNISVLLLDHVGKDSGNGSRGASRKLDEMDVAWELRTLMPFDRQQMGMIQLKRRKDREAWLAPTVEFEIGGDPFVMKRVDGGDVPEPPSLRNTLAAIEGFGADGAKYADWLEAAKDLGTGRTQFTEARKELMADGRVVKSGNLYHAVDFSPGAQPDLIPEHLVRDPQPDLTGLDDKNAQSGVEMGKSRSGGPAGLDEDLSTSGSPVGDPTLGGSRAGLTGRGGVETDKKPYPTPEEIMYALQKMEADLTRHPINLYADLVDGGYFTHEELSIGTLEVALEGAA